MAYSNLETSLGVGNFRRELSGLLEPLSKVQPINPVTEDLSDVKTFNKRFKQLGEALRYCFYATGDIAIRDKRYLETFLSHFTNPVVDRSYQFADKAAHYANANWDANGVPITYPAATRVEYNVDCLGKLNFAAITHFVFVDGKLLPKSEYDLVNTAYGVKCYIKAIHINDNSVVGIKVHRLYNTSKDYVTKTIASTDLTGGKCTLYVPVANLGTFYHHKYINVVAKRTIDGLTAYVKFRHGIDFITEINTTGDTARIIFSTLPQEADQLFIMNGVYYWEYEASSANGDTWSNEIEIKEKLEDNSYRPVPIGSIEDFDVYLNGYHLTAGKHYTLIYGGNEFSGYKIKLLANKIDDDAEWRIRIVKNECVMDDADCIIIRQDTMQEQGLITTNTDIATIPLMPRLGSSFLNQKYLSNDWFKPKHRQVMELDVSKVDTLKDFEYRLRIVNTIDINSVIKFVVDNYSEFDIVAEYVGLDNIMNTIYADEPNVTVDPNDQGVEEEYSTVFEFFSPYTAAVEQLRVISNYYYQNRINNRSDLVLDANVSPTEHPINITEHQMLKDNVLLLDANMKQSKIFVLDANQYFINGFPTSQE